MTTEERIAKLGLLPDPKFAVLDVIRDARIAVENGYNRCDFAEFRNVLDRTAGAEWAHGKIGNVRALSKRVIRDGFVMRTEYYAMLGWLDDAAEDISANGLPVEANA